MNVYDFDNTIYKGDSTADFIIWCVKRKPQLAFKLLSCGASYISYITKNNSKTKKFAVLTSGGDASGMNACVRACVFFTMDR